MGRNARPWIVGVSGGPDSVYLLHRLLRWKGRLLAAHLDHGWRGKEAERDRFFVEDLAAKIGVATKSAAVRTPAMGGPRKPPSEAMGRVLRRSFLADVKKQAGAGKILLGHTADDQIETILMRMMEGAGISGLKGIPRKTNDGIERPLLDTWKEDILKYLHAHKIPYRVDTSNIDTRFERNWIRHILIPMLEKRYGKAVKKRIFAVGERFREIDEFLEDSARSWIRRNVQGRGAFRIPRERYSRRPPALRKKILQLLCFERVGVAPNERLLESMDRILVSGGPSARQNVGMGAVLRCRYDQAHLEMTKPEGKVKIAHPTRSPGKILWEEKGRVPAAELKRLSKGERAAAFDAAELRAPVSVRPLRAGDRIRPFGLDAEKKVKKVLSDRKISREERWGRPVVCDAEGRILWIPGVVRSSHAAVTHATKRTVLLRIALPPKA